MALTTFDKSASATLDYTFDWATYLNDQGTISASSWSADSGLTVESDAYTNTSTTAFISGGAEGNSYVVSNTIETTNGLTVTRSFIIKVELR